MAIPGGPAKLAILFERQKGVCAICRRQMAWGARGHDAPSLDHKVPQSHGGGHNQGNLRATHKRCNGLRGNRGLGDRTSSTKPSRESVLAAAYARHLSQIT